MSEIAVNKIQVHPSNGLKETIAQMNFLEQKAINTPAFVTWVHKNLNSNCAPCIPGKVWKFMRNYFRFKKDDPFDEIVIAPYLMPDLRRGDCDDFSLFAKTCMDILGGWFTSYMVLGVERDVFTHVVLYANRGGSGNNVIDPVIIDGANSVFNVMPEKYNWFKIL